jgi:broad specificity phosphatase PhoE
MTVDIEFILIRHGEVEPRFKEICYGAMDVPLGENGRSQSLLRAKDLCDSAEPQAIFHSGLSRTKFLADEIARLAAADVPVTEAWRLRERNFGDWQGQSWDDVYASDPEHFNDLIEKPDTYRPPGGETTSEMQARAVQWLFQQTDESRRSSSGPIIAISHSGPIAAIAGHVQDLHATQWERWTIGNLDGIRVSGDLRDAEVEWTVEKYLLRT